MWNNIGCNQPPRGWNKYSRGSRGRKRRDLPLEMLNNRGCNHLSEDGISTVKEGREGIYN
jgi:hypothetical protein